MISQNYPKQEPSFYGKTFSEMIEFAKTDPEGYSDWAVSIIQKYISSLPEDKRLKLEQSQWMLDMKHYREIKDPVARCNYLVERMFDNIKQLNLVWKEVVKETQNIQDKLEELK